MRYSRRTSTDADSDMYDKTVRGSLYLLERARENLRDAVGLGSFRENSGYDSPVLSAHIRRGLVELLDELGTIIMEIREEELE